MQRRFPIAQRGYGPSLRAAHGVGAAQGLPQPGPASPQADPRDLEMMTVLEQLDHGLLIPIPAYYTVSMTIEGVVDAVAGGSTGLRPERFLCQRITWASTQDCLPAFNEAGFPLSGRTVRVAWQDEFTRFFGEQPSMPSAVFGDSQGFLDLQMPVLFQGRQTLSVNMRRIFWPEGEDAVNTDWDFTFHGLGLLPRATGGVSGSLNTPIRVER